MQLGRYGVDLPEVCTDIGHLLLCARDVSAHLDRHLAETLELFVKAVEKQKESPDAVFLDVWLPGVDGIEALREMKKKQPAMEVIMLTGHASVDVAVEIMRLGGYEYLLKPCPTDELMEKG